VLYGREFERRPPGLGGVAPREVVGGAGEEGDGGATELIDLTADDEQEAIDVEVRSWGEGS
jgi:hypothetical protein